MVYLVFMILIQAGVELLGVSYILPFVQLILQPEQLYSYPLISGILEQTHINGNTLVIVMCGLLILIYVIKNILLIYITNLQYKFTYYGQRDLSNRILKCYLFQDYSFHLKYNSAELIRDISTDTGMFYTTVLAVLQLSSELVVSAILIIYLLCQDALITMGVALALGFMMVFFMGKYKRRLVSLGNDRRKYAFAMQLAMQQSFSGIKEIKAAGRENYFSKQYNDASAASAEALRRNLFLNAIPKPMMETLCIIGLVSVVCVRILQGAENEDFVGTMAVFAVAAFRLLPSVNKISGYIGNIYHNGVVINKVYDTIKDIERMERNICKETSDKLSYRREIMFDRVSFKYSDAENKVLENITFKIEKNQAVAFVGTSGAGKTTLVDLLLGLLQPTDGTIQVDNADIREHMEAWKNLIGYIPQNIYMLDDTIANNIVFGGSPDEAQIWKALEEAQLADFVRKLPAGIHTVIGENGARISGGQRQRIGIARALYRNPEVLVLDEATSALDTETEAAVMNAIERLQGKLTIIIIAHRLSTIETCDVVYEVKEGKVSRRR